MSLDTSLLFLLLSLSPFTFSSPPLPPHTFLFPFFLFLPFILSVSFHLSTPPSSRHCASHSSPPKKRKWKNGKSCSLLWHPCLPTHNAVLRFVQLLRSLLVCMYPSTPPSSTFPLSPNKGGGCCIFSCKTSCNVTPTSTILIVVVVSTLGGVCQKLQRERETPVNAASPQPLTKD